MSFKSKDLTEKEMALLKEMTKDYPRIKFPCLCPVCRARGLDECVGHNEQGPVEADHE